MSTAFNTLQRLVRRPHERPEFCELCAAALAPAHAHLLQLETRNVSCACEPCSILFGGNARQRYRRIPRDAHRLRDFQLEDQEWKGLLIPINLAFFTYNSAADHVQALYPSPGGVVEAQLMPEDWASIAGRNPILARFEPDVEALLVNRLKAEPLYYRAPIDRCYRLVGLIRRHWHGLSGGHEVWTEIDRYFQELAAESLDYA